MNKPIRVAGLAAMAAVALAVTACSSANPGSSGSSGDTSPIVVGVSGPLTGNQAEYGKNWQEGFEIALDEINDAGGVQGRPLEIDFQDSQGEASQATTIAQRFVSDDSVLAVIGDFSSATSMVASPLYQRGEVLQLGITNSHPDFTTTGDFIFSPSITQQAEAREIEDAAHEQGSKIAIFNLNTDWGNAALEILKDQAEKNGDEIVFQAPVEEASTDFKPQLVQARDAKPDVVIFYTYYSTTALLVKQAQQVGLTDVPFIGVGSNYSQEFLELAGPAAEGFVVDTTFYDGSTEPDVQKFVTSYTEKFGHKPNLFAAYAYDGLKQLAWAADNAKSLDRTGIRDALRDGKDIPSIIYGPFSYAEDRRVAAPPFSWLEVEDGEFVVVGE